MPVVRPLLVQRKPVADVILLERGTYLGGIAASSMISNVYNHYVTRDGRLVMRGIGLEWMQRMMKKNAAAERWQYPDGTAGA